MKLAVVNAHDDDLCPAAFGRLCVETKGAIDRSGANIPAAFGRLCVETDIIELQRRYRCPAAFGRLCVETIRLSAILKIARSSRLRAAVC